MHCYVCKHSDARESPDDGIISVSCPLCGSYRIEQDLAGDLEPRAGDLRLCGVLKLRAAESSPILLTRQNVADFARLAPTTVAGRMQAFLKFLYLKTQHLGASVKVVNETDFPAAFCRRPEEFLSYLRAMEERGWMSRGHGEGLRLTLEGMEQAEATAELRLDRVFIAMSFKADRLAISRDAIKPAVRRAGYEAFRVDDIQHNGTINDRIIAEIKESHFVVADFTGHSDGVYFEAGYALGLGKPVIFTCHEPDIGGLHFDTKMYNVITWNEHAELAEKLFQRIRATIGYGPHVKLSDEMQP